MNGRRSAVTRPDGRIRLRVDLPPDVVADAERIVSATGLDRETVLGDLAATALPAALAEAADHSVARPARARLYMKQPPALAGGAPRPSALQRPAGTSLPPDNPETGPGVGTD